MAKPFRLSSQSDLGIARGASGRFEKLVTPLPAQVIAKHSADNGATNNDANRAARVPDRMVGSGAPKDVGGPGAKAPAPVYADAIPWPEAGPNNDADRKPFRVTR
jgi:hypothetical protein